MLLFLGPDSLLGSHQTHGVSKNSNSTHHKMFRISKTQLILNRSSHPSILKHHLLDRSSSLRSQSNHPSTSHHPLFYSTTRQTKPNHLIQSPTPPHQKTLKPNPSQTTHYRITLFRSAIGLTQNKHDTLASLGLTKRMKTVYHRHSGDMAGLILNVKELLKVENVSEAEMELGLKSTRKLKSDDRGYRLLYNVRSHHTLKSMPTS